MAPGFGPIDQSLPCPCGGGLYQQCCRPFHQGLRKPASAEALMRSRYSAFVRSEIAYLLETHPEPAISPRERRRQLRSSCGPNQWLGLTILGAPRQQSLDPPEILPVDGPAELDGKGLGQIPSFESRRLDVGQVVGQCFVTKMGGIQQLLRDQIIFLAIQIVE